MKSLKGLGCLFLLLAMLAPSAHADDVWTMAESPSYGRKAAGMFGRGLLNIVTSPVDLIVQTVEKTQQGPPFIGTLAGLGSGLGCTVVRLGSGALDIITFWIPSFNGIPVSRSYSNCLESPDAGKNWEGTQYAAPSSTTNWNASSVAPSSTTTWATDTTSYDSNAYVDKSGNRYVDKSGSPYGSTTARYVSK